jgi:hypothetical protein
MAGGETDATAMKKMTVGAEGAFVLPFGKWSDGSGIGIGVFGRLDYALSSKLAITAHPGYIYHLAKDVNGVDLSTAELLILAGVRFWVTPQIVVFGETGIDMFSLMASAGGQSRSDSNNRIPLNLGAGYAISPALSVNASLLMPNFLLREDGEDNLMGLMASVGYNFASF